MDRETYLEHRDRAGEGHDTERCPICQARKRTVAKLIREGKRWRAAIKASFGPDPDNFIGRG